MGRCASDVGPIRLFRRGAQIAKHIDGRVATWCGPRELLNPAILQAGGTRDRGALDAKRKNIVAMVRSPGRCSHYQWNELRRAARWFGDARQTRLSNRTSAHGIYSESRSGVPRRGGAPSRIPSTGSGSRVLTDELAHASRRGSISVSQTASASCRKFSAPAGRTKVHPQIAIA